MQKKPINPHILFWGGGAPLGVAATEVQVYKRLCVSVHGVLTATLYHTSAFHEFVHMHCCVCFTLRVCEYVCVLTVILYDRMITPFSPELRGISQLPLPFLHQPQRRDVRSHVCQRLFPVGSGAPLHFCLPSPFSLRLPTSSQEPLWHLITKSTASGAGRTYGAHNMMSLRLLSFWPAGNSGWRVSAGLLYFCT